jgi:disulfide bond formation protein DsbB
MKSRTLLATIAGLCIGFVLFALYLQRYHDILPCPLCVLQRYAYIALAVIGVAGALWIAPRIASALAFVAAAAGAGTAAYQLWVESHPSISCGGDPLERSLNQLFTAKLWPFVFRSEGFCTDVYEPILGLTTPQWSLAWFVLFALTFLWVMLRR